MHPVHGNKCFQKQTVHIWCKNAEWAEICITYRGAISRSSVAWTAASIVLCIGHSEVCWQIVSLVVLTHLIFSRICIGSQLINALTYIILNSSQPAYLRSLLSYHSPIRSLRSANTNLLSVSRVRTTFASRGFSIAAPTVWNSLPSSTRSSTSADTFRRLLKTHCFQQAYCSL